MKRQVKFNLLNIKKDLNANHLKGSIKKNLAEKVNKITWKKRIFELTVARRVGLEKIRHQEAILAEERMKA